LVISGEPDGPVPRLTGDKLVDWRAAGPTPKKPRGVPRVAFDASVARCRSSMGLPRCRGIVCFALLSALIVATFY